MTISTKRVAQVANAQDAAWVKQVDTLAHFPGGKPNKALALKPSAAKFARAVLYKLLRSAKESAQRAALVLELLAYLRKALPTLLKELPISPKDFGFRNIDEFAQFLAERLHALKTLAKSFREFSREESLRGLRWQLIGKVLFERLVKYNRRLNNFFLGWAEDFRGMVNNAIRQRGFTWMLDGRGDRRKVIAPFRKPQKVMEFRLEGDETVRAEFTDFGTLAENSADQVLLTPIEIKLPAAMQGVKGQIGSFKDRLSKADLLVAVMEDGTERRIDPKRVVFDEESTHHLVVTLYGTRRWEDEGLNPIVDGKRLFDVKPISELKPVGNPLTGTTYYALRLTVLRDWLADIVKLVTDPQAQ